MVRLRWLRNMNSHRSPWEVVGPRWLRLRILRLQCRVVRRSLSCARVGPHCRRPGWRSLLWEHHPTKLPFMRWRLQSPSVSLRKRMRHPLHLRRLQCPRDTVTFSVCCISSALVLPRSLLLRSAGCVILRGFFFCAPHSRLEGAPTLFHRVAELRQEHQTRFHAAAEVGKVVVSALPSHRRDRGCCSDPSIASSAPMNPAIPRLVGALSSNRCSLSFSFEEAATVESLCYRLLAAQSSGFWYFSALLHWLKELGFESPDPSLVCDSDFVPDVAFLCSFLHVTGFSGSQPMRMPAVLVLCFGLSFVPIVTPCGTFYADFLLLLGVQLLRFLFCIFPSWGWPVRFLCSSQPLSGAENRAHLRRLCVSSLMFWP